MWATRAKDEPDRGPTRYPGRPPCLDTSPTSTPRAACPTCSLSGEFTDWPDLGEGGDAVRHYDPQYCGRIMRDWEKFTAIGAIGPDLFFFSEDWNSDLVGPHSDQIMLALAIYYFFDAANEDEWEPLLIILEEVNSTMAAIIRFLLKLQRIWDDFVDAWNKTIGPFVDAASEILDDLTGGLISQFQVALDELMIAIKLIGEEELTTFADIWGLMNTVVQKGWSERLVPVERHDALPADLGDVPGARPAGRGAARRHARAVASGSSSSWPSPSATSPTSARTRSRTRSSTSNAAARTATTRPGTT